MVAKNRPSHKPVTYLIMSKKCIKTTRMGHLQLFKPKPRRRRPTTESSKQTKKSNSLKWGRVTAQTNAQRQQFKAPGRIEASPSTHHKNKKKRKPHNNQWTNKDITPAKQLSKSMINLKDLLSIYPTKTIRRDKPKKMSLHKHNGSWPKTHAFSTVLLNLLENWRTRFKAYKNESISRIRYCLTCLRPWKKWRIN